MYREEIIPTKDASSSPIQEANTRMEKLMNMRFEFLEQTLAGFQTAIATNTSWITSLEG